MNDDAESAARRRGAGVLLRLIKSREGRAMMSNCGHKPGQPVIVVLDTDTLGEVIGRMVDESLSSPVIVAMYGPAENRLVMWSFAQGEFDTADYLQRAGSSSTIAMLYDAMQGLGVGRLNLTITSPARLDATLKARELVAG